MNNRYDRRDFLKLGTTLGAGLALGSASPSSIANSPKESPKQINAAPIETVRIGFVGVGSRGSRHVQLLLKIEGLEIRAICDIVEERVKRAQRWVQEAGQPCWQLVETSEKTARHCVMMENCCYSRWMLMVLNMVRQGIFGELLHGECGYLHDCRALLLSPATIAQWATAHLIKRNGDLYPTHGLGPLAQCMNINRGDQFDYLVSMGGNSRGLNLFAAKKLGPDSPQVRQRYAQSDIVTTLIRTKNGGTIFLKFDMCSPRPYSRIDLLQGTKGIFRGYPEEKIYIEGKSPEHAWESTDKYKQEYEHPLWKALGESGGMDYIENYRLIKSLRTGIYPDMDVYDAAAWSVVSELSERSMAGKSRSMDFPDFTRGRWKTNKPLGIVEV
jgi:predicted dehydrogenase